MEMSETNDDMDMNLDAGQLLLPGDDLDLELASMRDPSLEPDPDFMVEDVLPESDMNDVGMATKVEEHDDEMLDEDAHEANFAPTHDPIDYHHGVQDEFDDTIIPTESSRQDFEFSSDIVQVDTSAITEELTGVATTDVTKEQAAIEQNVQETSTPQSERHEDSAQLQDPPTTHRPAATVETKSQHSLPSNTEHTEIREQVGKDVTNEATTEFQVADEDSRTADAIEKLEEESENTAHNSPKGDQECDSTTHVGAPNDDEQDRPHVEEQSNEEAQELHPVKVFHEGSEVFLFPPTEEDSSDTFFLHDESLSRQSLSVLLKACREVLGDSISEEDELEIEFHDLGIQTSEESNHASQITMSEIIAVYLRLRWNDGDSSPQPLFASLRCKPHFSSRFYSIRKAADGGKGSAHLGLTSDTFNTDPSVALANSPDTSAAQNHGEADEEGENEDHQNSLVIVQPTDVDDQNQENEDSSSTVPQEHASYQDFDDTTAVTDQLPPGNISPGEVENNISLYQNDQSDSAEASDNIVDINDAESTTQQEEDLRPEGDFFDDAVQGYEDGHEEDYELDSTEPSGDEPTRQVASNLAAPDDEHFQEEGEHGTDESFTGHDDYEESSFTFVPADEFDQKEQAESNEERQDSNPRPQIAEENAPATVEGEAENDAETSAHQFDGHTYNENVSYGDTKPPEGLSTPLSTPEPRDETKVKEDAEIEAVASPGTNRKSGSSENQTNGSRVHTPPEPVYDDSDEINYDDDEDLPTTAATEQTTPKSKSNPTPASPKSTKRNRFDEEEDLIEYATPDPKRRRS